MPDPSDNPDTDDAADLPESVSDMPLPEQPPMTDADGQSA